MSDFNKAVELAGFFLAHALPSVSEGEALIALVGHEGAGGRSMHRFVGETGPQMAEQFLATNPEGVTRAVSVCDAYVTYGGVRKDTLLAQVVEYASGKRLTIGIPYTPAKDGEPFAVHKPKFLEQHGIADDEFDGLGEALFRGVDAHSDGEKIWTAHLDQSF